MKKEVIKKLARKASPQSASTSTGWSSGSKASSNVNAGELYAMIQKKAFELYAKRGYTHGNDKADWYNAEKAVRASLKK